ncbi:MAG: DoxX family protein [Proteobacteria bacterium]|nr:DoxX family protein [Pseudomonadota bacterium]
MQFDWSGPLTPLRILCGVTFVPHIAAKLFARPLTLGFFKAAGFRPAAAFLAVALAVEVGLATCLTLGLWVRYAALAAFVFMSVAAASVFKVSRGRWLWNTGGCEYCVFLACACLLVFIYA